MPKALKILGFRDWMLVIEMELNQNYAARGPQNPETLDLYTTEDADSISNRWIIVVNLSELISMKTDFEVG